MDILGETVPIKSRRWDGVPGYGEFQHGAPHKTGMEDYDASGALVVSNLES